MATQRFESSVTAVSWIPSEAITGPSKVPFQAGVTHYDEPPPDRLVDLEELRTTDRFREANELRAFIEVEDSRNRERRALWARATSARRPSEVGPSALRFPAVQLPDIRPEPEMDGIVGAVCADGRRPDGPPDATASPAQAVCPVLAVDRMDHLSLTINADGSSSHELIGASPFPRHWVYDHAERSSRSPR